MAYENNLQNTEGFKINDCLADKYPYINYQNHNPYFTGTLQSKFSDSSGGPFYESIYDKHTKSFDNLLTTSTYVNSDILNKSTDFESNHITSANRSSLRKYLNKNLGIGNKTHVNNRTKDFGDVNNFLHSSPNSKKNFLLCSSIRSHPSLTDYFTKTPSHIYTNDSCRNKKYNSHIPLRHVGSSFDFSSENNQMNHYVLSSSKFWPFSCKAKTDALKLNVSNNNNVATNCYKYHFSTRGSKVADTKTLFNNHVKSKNNYNHTTSNVNVGETTSIRHIRSCSADNVNAINNEICSLPPALLIKNNNRDIKSEKPLYENTKLIEGESDDLTSSDKELKQQKKDYYAMMDPLLIQMFCMPYGFSHLDIQSVQASYNLIYKALQAKYNQHQKQLQDNPTGRKSIASNEDGSNTECGSLITQSLPPVANFLRKGNNILSRLPFKTSSSAQQPNVVSAPNPSTILNNNISCGADAFPSAVHGSYIAHQMNNAKRNQHSPISCKTSTLEPTGASAALVADHLFSQELNSNNVSHHSMDKDEHQVCDEFNKPKYPINLNDLPHAFPLRCGNERASSFSLSSTATTKFHASTAITGQPLFTQEHSNNAGTSSSISNLQHLSLKKKPLESALTVNAATFYGLDQGDGISNELVESCAYFRNEIGTTIHGVTANSPYFLSSSSIADNSSTKNIKSEICQAPKDDKKLAKPTIISTLPFPSVVCNSVSLLDYSITHYHFLKQHDHDPTSPKVGWKQKLPAHNSNYKLEHLDPGAFFYRSCFVGKEHYNFFGVDEHIGHIAISLKYENGHLNSTSDTDFNIEPHVKIIIRTSQLCAIKGYVPNLIFSPNLKHTFAQPTPETVIRYVCPYLNIGCLRNADPQSTPKIEEMLLRFDELLIKKNYKIGILYCKNGQTTEEEMYNNDNESPYFQNFLSLLGDRVRLKGFTKYKGELDVKTDATGLYSLYTTFNPNPNPNHHHGLTNKINTNPSTTTQNIDTTHLPSHENYTFAPNASTEMQNSPSFLPNKNSTENLTDLQSQKDETDEIIQIMFHVSTWLPHVPNHKQQLLRKRHIGNDIVTIIFQDPYLEDFNATTWLSQTHHSSNMKKLNFNNENSPLVSKLSTACTEKPKTPLAFSAKRLRSHYQHVFIIVRPIIVQQLQNGSKPQYSYKVAISRSKNLEFFGPILPNDGVFHDPTHLRDFLLTKCINGVNATAKSPKFANMALRAKQTCLKDLYNSYGLARDHSSTDPLLLPLNMKMPNNILPSSNYCNENANSSLNRVPWLTPEVNSVSSDLMYPYYLQNYSFNTIPPYNHVCSTSNIASTATSNIKVLSKISQLGSAAFSFLKKRSHESLGTIATNDDICNSTQQHNHFMTSGGFFHKQPEKNYDVENKYVQRYKWTNALTETNNKHLMTKIYDNITGGCFWPLSHLHSFAQTEHSNKDSNISSSSSPTVKGSEPLYLLVLSEQLLYMLSISSCFSIVQKPYNKNKNGQISPPLSTLLANNSKIAQQAASSQRNASNPNSKKEIITNASKLCVSPKLSYPFTNKQGYLGKDNLASQNKLIDIEFPTPLFFIPTCSIIGWNYVETSNNLTIYFNDGDCILAQIDPSLISIDCILARLQQVTQGTEALTFTIEKCNSEVQLGIYIQEGGFVTDIEVGGLAWNAGIRKGFRIMELCHKYILTLNLDQIFIMLKNAINIHIVAIPPNTPKNVYNAQHSHKCKNQFCHFFMSGLTHHHPHTLSSKNGKHETLKPKNPPFTLCSSPQSHQKENTTVKSTAYKTHPTISKAIQSLNFNNNNNNHNDNNYIVTTNQGIQSTLESHPTTKELLNKESLYYNTYPSHLFPQKTSNLSKDKTIKNSCTTTADETLQNLESHLQQLINFDKEEQEQNERNRDNFLKNTSFSLDSTPILSTSSDTNYYSGSLPLLRKASYPKFPHSITLNSECPSMQTQHKGYTNTSQCGDWEGTLTHPHAKKAPHQKIEHQPQNKLLGSCPKNLSSHSEKQNQTDWNVIIDDTMKSIKTFEDGKIHHSSEQLTNQLLTQQSFDFSTSKKDMVQNLRDKCRKLEIKCEKESQYKANLKARLNALVKENEKLRKELCMLKQDSPQL